MKFLLNGVILFLSIFSYLFADQASLTQKELNFLKNTPEIRCVTTDSWAPFNIQGKDKNVVGISIDFWDIIVKEVGINTKKCKALDSFTEVLDAIKMKKADITLSTSASKDRLEYALFTKSYASFPIVIATNNKVGFIADTAELNGKKVAVGKGFTSAMYLQNGYKDIDYVEVKNISEALLLLEAGEVYAIVEVLPVLAYMIKKNGYSDIKISGKTEFMFDVQMMVRKDYPELVSIINHEIGEISQEKRNEILNKWFSVEYTEKIYYEILFYLGSILLLALLFGYYREVTFKKYNKQLSSVLIQLEDKNILLEKLSITDKLTGLNNRAKLDEMLELNYDMFLRYKNIFSIILLDIDDFKNVNDGYGHLIGDEVLKIFAKILGENIRTTDILGRWGGEEFMIISPKTDTVGASKLAHILKEKISEHVFEDIGKITASFGVAQIDDGDTMEEVVAAADVALYSAKSSGKNRVVCSL